MDSSLILMPFLAVVVLNIFYKTVLKKAAIAVGLAVSLYQVLLCAYPRFFPWSQGLDFLAGFFKLNLFVDPFAVVMLVTIGVVSFVTLLCASALIADTDKKFNFASLFLIILSGMNGIVLVRDIFSLYIFLEITAVISFVLIASDKDILALEGAFKYIILSAVATTFMLTSIALFLMVAGSMDFTVIADSLRATPDARLAMFAVALFVSGLMIKAGLMPFHGWVPDAYASAPGPVAVLLAGIVTKIVGVYALIRLVTCVFGFSVPLRQSLMVVGAVSIVFGALAAMGQKDFRRMLAYSSISQVGYIVLGLGCGSLLGVAGAVFHFFNHAIFKSLLFVNAVAVEKGVGHRETERISGLANRMPLTGTTSILASLSASGIPPLAGFWSKLLIIIALWSAGFYGFAAIAVLASVLTLGYLLVMQRKIFFGPLEGTSSALKEAGLSMSIAALTLSAIALGAGIFFPYVFNKFILPAADVLMKVVAP